MKIVDQFSDPTLAVLVHLVADRPKIASTVGDADIKPEEAEGLPDTAFAWPEKRAFPIFSPEHAILSRVYRENHPAVPAHVDVAIKEACDVYGIPDAIFERVKIAAPVDNPDDYLLPDLKRLPVRSAAQVKEAEEKLVREFTKLSMTHRAMACKRLVDKAAQFDVTLHPLMHKFAGFTVTSTRVLTDWIEARREAAPEQYKSAFQKLADTTKTLPAEIRDRQTQIKLAETIGELDQMAGLVEHYDRRLPDAMLTVFNTEKIAGAGVDLNGTFVPTARLASYPSTFYSDVLGDDIVREAADGHGGIDPHRLAAILETLPRDMKNVLAQQMR